MPSQEDYLDALLEGLEGKEEQETKPDPIPDFDDIGSMTEDEIISLLSSSAEEEPRTVGEEPRTLEEDPRILETEPDDLSDVLANTPDEDLQEIQMLLEKADSNERIDDFAAESGESPEENPAGRLAEEIAGGEVQETAPVEKESASERRQRRRELAAAKKAERAEKKAAKKAEKQAKREESKRKGKKEEETFDTSLLDSIVAEAEKVDLPGQDAEKEADAFDLNGLFDDGGDMFLEQTDSGEELPDFGMLSEEDTDIALRNISQRAEGNKKGFFAKVLDFFTEEDEEEADDAQENEDIKLSEENQEILKDLDKEKTAGKKKKKGKKGKKNRGGELEEENPERTGRFQRENPKKEKLKKERKPKRKETPEGDLVPRIPEKRLSPKKVIPVLFVVFSLGVLLLVFANSAADYADRRAARTAFYEQDYHTCYQNLFGKELDESEQVMYAKSESILRIRLWLKEYEMFVDEGSELEALDSLIQTVDRYPDLYAYAVQWNAGAEVSEQYAEVLRILSEKYGLTEGQAQAIADEPKDVEYTRKVLAIVQGDGFGSWNEAAVEALPEQPELEDELPEEAELGGETFIDNQ